MFNFQRFEQDLTSKTELSSKAYKQYANEIEDSLLDKKDFPQEIFHIYLQILDSPERLQIYGIYQFFRQLYNDFDKLSESQKQRLKLSIKSSLKMQLEHNLEHYLSEIMLNKYE